MRPDHDWNAVGLCQFKCQLPTLARICLLFVWLDQLGLEHSRNPGMVFANSQRAPWSWKSTHWTWIMLDQNLYHNTIALHCGSLETLSHHLFVEFFRRRNSLWTSQSSSLPTKTTKHGHWIFIVNGLQFLRMVYFGIHVWFVWKLHKLTSKGTVFWPQTTLLRGKIFNLRYEMIEQLFDNSFYFILFLAYCPFRVKLFAHWQEIWLGIHCQSKKEGWSSHHQTFDWKSSKPIQSCL